jgi:hypothetical protein
MTTVYLLQQADYEEVLCLGVFTTWVLAEASRDALWEVFVAFPVEQRFDLVCCPFPAWQVAAKLDREPVTREDFARWYPIVPMELDTLQVDLVAARTAQ